MSRIALIGENSAEYVNKLLDIWDSGDCAVLIDWRTPFETAYQMMLEAGVVECYIESRLTKNIILSKYSSVSFSLFEISDNSPHLLPDSVRAKYQENTNDEEAVILYSSGTTGKSKEIILSHYAVTTNADAILDYMRLDHNDCLYIVKSLSHSSTLTGELVVALRSGANVVLAPTVVPPRYVLIRLRTYSVTILCLNPTLLRMYYEECRKKEYNLGSLKTIYCSGAVLYDKVYSEAHEILKGINIFNVYGLSEAGPRVAAQTEDCCKSNSVGKAIKGVEVIIVREDGILASNGELGIIHVKTPSLYSGYILGTQKNKSLYNSWLNTGDIGYIDEYGELHITNRVDDVITINSHKVYLGDIKRLILENKDVTDCAVCKSAYDGLEFIECLYVSITDCTVSIIHHLKEKLMDYEIPKRF